MIYERPFRAAFASGIVAEFLPPAKPSRKVVIVCDGLPSMPAKRELLQKISRNGYWGFHLRYRGTWESKGDFLNEPPSKDVQLLIDHLEQNVVDIWTGKRFRVRPLEINVIGSSFGGAVAISASTNSKVYKAVAMAPVCDWRSKQRGESPSELKRVIKTGFSPVYRFNERNWKRLVSGRLFNPISDKISFDTNKLLLIHAIDDPVVHVSQSEVFSEKHGITLMKLRAGGHLSTSDIFETQIWKLVFSFFNR